MISPYAQFGWYRRPSLKEPAPLQAALHRAAGNGARPQDTGGHRSVALRFRLDSLQEWYHQLEDWYIMIHDMSDIKYVDISWYLCVCVSAICVDAPRGQF